MFLDWDITKNMGSYRIYGLRGKGHVGCMYMIWYVYIYTHMWYDRRNFWSQTSDTMDRWSSRGGKSQRRERTEKEDQRRERVGRKNSNMREKVEKVAKHCFSNVLWLRQEVRKVGSLKRQVRSHLVGWEMKNAKHLGRGALLEVKMFKTTRGSEHFWQVSFWKCACGCGVKHISKSKW